MIHGSRTRRPFGGVPGVTRPVLFILGLVAVTQWAIAAGSGAFDIRDYGAVGDGVTLDTPAIHKAIETCAAAGGGQVRFPPGRYLSGTVHLRSRVTLFLEAGATLQGCETYFGGCIGPLCRRRKVHRKRGNGKW
jgi:hypothetical protein